MNYTLPKTNLMLLLLLVLWATPSKSEPAGNQGFQFSYERYQEGSKHFDGTKYLSMVFEVKAETKQNQQSFTARLKKGIVSEGHRSGWGYYKYRYFETGEPINENESFYTKIALSFFKSHPIHFSVKDGQVIVENAKLLKAGLGAAIKSAQKLRLPHDESNALNVAEIRKLFQHLFVQLPDELKKPGDMQLKSSVVFQYRGNYHKFMHLKVNDIRKHETQNLFILPSSNLIRYSEINGLPAQQIIRVLPLETGENIHIQGQFPRNKNTTIQFIADANSSLIPTKTFSVHTNSTGKFSLVFNSNDPLTIHASTGFDFYAEPGDDFSFTANSAQDTLHFSGIGAGNNEYLLAESRLPKLGIPKGVRNQQTQSAWFKRADAFMTVYLKQLENYKNSLTPKFYETKYLNYYFGKLNRKIECAHSWFRFSTDENGILNENLMKLDTVVHYQPFIFNREFNRYLHSQFLRHFEELRRFIYKNNYTAAQAPSDKEILQMASLSNSGKTLYDFLEYMAPRIYFFASQQDIDALHETVEDYFDHSSLQQRIKELEIRNVKIKAGDQFPPVTFKNIKGEEVKLSQFQGQVIYLLFWRNDALVLNREWDEFQQLAQEMKNQKVVFINVGMEENFENWQNYVNGMELNGLSLFVDRNSPAFKTYLKGLKNRHYLLISKNEKVINNNGPYPDEAKLQITQNLGYTNREKLLAGGLVMILSVLFILGAIWTISRIRQKRRAKINELTNRLRETELKAIKAQMNPHFLFNSLNSIQNLINQKDIEAANQYLSRFARLLRAVLQHSEKEFVPLSDEIETLNLYVQLEKLRFNFEFDLEIDQKIDIHNTFVPPLLFQPFIENAILHGLQQKEGIKKLTIKINERDSQLICQIADNGVGRSMPSLKTKNHHGMGNKLSLERINLLNQKNNSNFKLQIDDVEPNGSGTVVTISFNSNLI